MGVEISVGMLVTFSSGMLYCSLNCFKDEKCTCMNDFFFLFVYALWMHKMSLVAEFE